MPGNIVDLPEEILARIVQQFHPQPSSDDPFPRAAFKALIQISRVSRQFQRLAEPLLYHSFPGHQQVNPRLWLSAVLARPGREKLVRRITINEAEIKLNHRRGLIIRHRHDEDWAFTYGEPLLGRTWKDWGRIDEHSIAMLRQVIETAGLEDEHRDRLRNALEKSLRQHENINLDLLMSLIVLVCPDLHGITISVWRYFDSALLPIALGRSGTIHDVNLHRAGTVDHDWEAVTTLATVLERRKVQSLKVTNVSLKEFDDVAVDWESTARPKEMAIAWPSMKHISLQDCKLPPIALGLLLRASPALTSLELKSRTGAELKYLPDHGDTIRKYARGLQRLVIDAGISWLGQAKELRHQMGKGIIGGVKSLHELTELRELEATLWTLLAADTGEPAYHLVDILPPSLQTLTILPCITMSLKMNADEEVKLLRQNPAFADLEVHVSDRVVERSRADYDEGTVAEMYYDNPDGNIAVWLNESDLAYDAADSDEAADLDEGTVAEMYYDNPDGDIGVWLNASDRSY